ncbi:SNF2-related protein [Enterocloster lavalensis]|uniref:SNF2-related protein n=1 Tax=Enterocloster lavalensis TaxID=460384 RepID=UPI0034A18E10
MHYEPHEYQRYATEKIIDLPACGLFLEMGLGKTVSTLTAINELIYDRFEVGMVLVIAPKRVADDTWTSEAEKWDHLQHLTFSKILGTAAQREAALQARADIYLINRENVVWLADKLRRQWPFDMVVVDELSSFKSNQAKRFKALRAIRPLVKRFVGLTGTPAPNGLMDLWPEVYLLDCGERLGKTITGYRDRYFYPGKRNGYTVFTWEPKEGAEEAIHQKISDICISMKAEDYLRLPEQVVNDIRIRLAPEEIQKYRELEKEKLMELDGQEITALSAAAVWGKLLQLANGAVYDDDGGATMLHDKKLDALEEIVEAACGHPVLVFYNFRHDYDRLMARFERLSPRTIQTSGDIRDWNAGRIRLLLAQPASMGHGLNIQAGGHIIVWFGLNPSLELYQQANARLHRQGQKQAVIIHRLITKGTVDEDVIKKLETKDQRQDSLMEAVKARIRRYKQ